jgi:ribosomal protein L32
MSICPTRAATGRAAPDACGEIADPRLTCAHCGEQITAHNVTPEAGPGFRTDLAAEELA